MRGVRESEDDYKTISSIDDENIMFYHNHGYDPGGIYPRAAVGDPGTMFELCPKCGALKLKPLTFPVESPGEVNFSRCAATMEW